MNALSNSVFWSLAAILLLSCFPTAAWGYWPFCRTDAAVTDVIEIEDIDLSCASGKRHGKTSSSMSVSGKALAVRPPTGCYNGFDF